MTVAPLLVIQHEDECPPGWFGEWFDDAGLPYVVLPVHRSGVVPDDLGPAYSGLLVLGGEMGAYDDEAHPWLAVTRDLIASTVRGDRPFLGICLGHQLAAVALGGEVRRNRHGHAKGLTPLRVTAAGADDTLLGRVADGAPSVMWNNDVVTRLPPGGVELATAPDGTVQAARFGARAWGVQLHPEASPDIFDAWTIAKPSATAPDGIDVPAAARAVRLAEPDLRRHWRPLAQAFVEVVREAAVGATAGDVGSTGTLLESHLP